VVSEHLIGFLEHLISVPLFLYRNILSYFLDISLSFLYSRTRIFRISGTLRFLFFYSCAGICLSHLFILVPEHVAVIFIPPLLSSFFAIDFWDGDGGWGTGVRFLNQAVIYLNEQPQSLAVS